MVMRRKQAKRSKKTKVNKKFMTLIHRLKAMRPTQRLDCIKKANSKFIQDISKAVRQLKYVDLKPSLKKQMRKRRKNLQKLSLSKTSLKSKRQILSQRGGILPLVLSAIPAIGSIIASVINRA